MNFNSEAICDLKDIHEQLSEAQEWDMSMETLMKVAHCNSLSHMPGANIFRMRVMTNISIVIRPERDHMICPYLY